MKEKNWPPFNTAGDLPPGIHQATLQQLLEHFGQGTAQRQMIARRLERIYKLAVETRLVAGFIVFGSFITEKPDPGDVDIFILMEDAFDANTVSGATALIFNHLSAQNNQGASIFWIRKLAALDGEDNTVAHWQIKRDGTQRGIVEVIKND